MWVVGGGGVWFSSNKELNILELGGRRHSVNAYFALLLGSE